MIVVVVVVVSVAVIGVSAHTRLFLRPNRKHSVRIYYIFSMFSMCHTRIYIFSVFFIINFVRYVLQKSVRRLSVTRLSLGINIKSILYYKFRTKCIYARKR